MHKAAVIGSPLSHSLSPFLFQEFSKATGRSIEYRAQEISADDLASAYTEAQAAGIVGWNVTLPHKVRILDFVGARDESVDAVGAANVVRFRDNRAFNTDAMGFLAPLEREGFSPFGHRALIFGAGGAARAVGAALKGARAADILFVNRTGEKARDLAHRFGGRALTPDDAQLPEELAQADLVINATSLGLGGEGTPLPHGLAPRKGAWAYDLVYNPAETPFLAAAEREGAQTFGGMPMLVAQGAAAWRLWFDETLPPAALKDAEAALARRLK
jgi:shikimate dehydrogenase